MPATTKAQLLRVTAAELAKLLRTIDDVDADTAVIADADDTSIKDVVAHRAHWIELFLGWYEEGSAGRPVSFPAPGYKWNELNRYNADLRARQRHLDWAAAKALLRDNAATLQALLERLSEDELYGGPMPGAKNDWTTGRWAEASGASHYRSATKYVRARLRALAAAG